MRIVFVQPPFKDYASKQPSLGLAYLSAVLKEKGADIFVIDANIEHLTVEETVKRILDLNPNIVGFTISTPLLNTSLEIVRQLKSINKNLTIIAGGPHPSVMPEDVLKGIDVLVRGEGEKTIEELYNHFENSKFSLSEIKGISYIHNNNFFHNPDRSFIDNLDEIPFPAWEYFDLGKYHGTVRKTNFNLPILTSRGCPYGCIFCSVRTIWGRCWRPRSPKNVVDELEYLINKFKIKEFTILDDNFTVNPKRAIEICDLIIKRGLTIPWCPANGIRVNTASVELFSKMKEAGCYRLYFGVESGNQEILNKINKQITLDQVRAAFKMAKEVGLETTAFLMIGNLGETEETMQQTIDFALELDPDFVQFTIATPYPGTDMYKKIKEDGRFLIKSWEDFASFKGAIFEYKDLTANLINKMHKKAYKSFYFRSEFVFKYIKNIKSPTHVKNLIYGGLTALKMITKK